MTKEITIYEKTNKNGVLYLYCEDCKPRGGKRGTLVVSGYDQFCAGCGHDLYEMAQDTTPEPDDDDDPYIPWEIEHADTAWQLEHPVEDDEELSPEDITAIREAMGQPSLGPYTFEEMCQVLEQERQLQHTWEQLQSVPAYTARFAREEVRVG